MKKQYDEICKKCSCFYGECQVSAGQEKECLENNHSKFEIYQCINTSCNWEGKKMDCSFFKSDKWHEKPFCPECHEVVEIKIGYNK